MSALSPGSHGVAASPLVRAWHALLERRDSLLANPAFRRWASAFPLTRPVARRSSQRLFDLCAGFVYSQVLLACVRLDLFRVLRRGGVMDCASVGRAVGLEPEAARRLLAAAATLDLVSRRGPEHFALGPMGAVILGDPGIERMVEHHALLYEDLRDPVALLKKSGSGGGVARYWPYADRSRGSAELDAEEVAPYSELMAASVQYLADEVLDAYPVERHGCLMDVGGGTGTFLAAAAARAPRLDLMLFDLPGVAERAQRRLEARGLGPRVKTVGGDFLRDELPAGADLISLVRIVHDHDDDHALELLRKTRRALEPGGRLLIAEPMADTPGAQRVGDAYFGFYLLAMGSGRPRSRQELRELLARAGYTKVKSVSTYTPLLAGLLVCE